MYSGESLRNKLRRQNISGKLIKLFAMMQQEERYAWLLPTIRSKSKKMFANLIASNFISLTNFSISIIYSARFARLAIYNS